MPAACTSARFSAVTHPVEVAQVVPRATPLIRRVEADTPAPGTKFAPCTASGKLSTAPEKTLDGNITSITGPLVIETVAVADFVESATLIAVTLMALGEGAPTGAVYRAVPFPVETIEPQAVPVQPSPGTALCTDQVTAEFVLPATFAKKFCVLGLPVDGGRKA